MKNELLIVWTTDNKDTIMNMICLYALNAKRKGWFEEVHLLIWGASQQIISDDNEIQEKLLELEEAGVRICACKKCTENMYIEGQLQKCGIDVFYTGELLSDWLKEGKPLLTF